MSWMSPSAEWTLPHGIISCGPSLPITGRTPPSFCPPISSMVLLSTHLIYEIENILDRVLFLRQGQIVLNAGVDEIRTQQGKSVDTLFREVFRC